MQRHFANVWATKDAKIYRVLAQLVNQDGFVDNRKAYEKNPKDYLNRLRDIAKNPKKYEKSFGRNFAQYINNPKPGQNYAKLPESLKEGFFMKEMEPYEYNPGDEKMYVNIIKKGGGKNIKFINHLEWTHNQVQILMVVMLKKC